MRHAAQVAAANPFAGGAFWNGGNPFDLLGGEAMRAWLDATTRLQAESSAFWTARMSKDMAALTAFAQCTTPAAAAEMQAQYAREAWADFEGEGRRLLRIVNEAGAFRLPGIPGSPLSTGD